MCCFPRRSGHIRISGIQVAHRPQGGLPVGALCPITPWSALCHIGSRCPGCTPRPIAAQTRQGYPYIFLSSFMEREMPTGQRVRSNACPPPAPGGAEGAGMLAGHNFNPEGVVFLSLGQGELNEPPPWVQNRAPHFQNPSTPSPQTFHPKPVPHIPAPPKVHPPCTTNNHPVPEGLQSSRPG